MSPSTSASSATSPSRERQRERKGVHASPKALGQAVRAVPHRPQGARQGHPRLRRRSAGIDRFDHNTLTSFPLEGKHQTTKCNDCHKEKTQSGTRTYLKAPVACASCHNNPHGDLRETCVAASAATTPRRGTCSTTRSSITTATRAIRSRRSTSAVKCAACHFTTQFWRSRPIRSRRCRRPTRPAIRS